MSTTEVYKKRKMNFEFELSKGKQNSLGETLKVVDFIKNNPKKVEHLFQCFYSENSLVAMRAMNGVKRIIKDDKKVFLKNKDRFLNQFSNSKHNVVKLGLITIYFDFLNHFEEKEVSKIKTIVLNWTKNSSDWMILAQGMKLLEKLSKSDKSLKLKLIEVAKRLKNDERKVVLLDWNQFLKFLYRPYQKPLTANLTSLICLFQLLVFSLHL